MTTDYSGWEPVAAGEYSGKREIVWGYKDSPTADVSMITVWTLALDSTWSGAETVISLNRLRFHGGRASISE